MDARSLTDLIRFDEERGRTELLTETANLWSQVICLQDSQGVGPMRDDLAEGFLLVLAGEVAIQAGKSRARLGQWATTTVAAGEDLTIRNASAEPSVVLLVLSPPPGTGAAPAAGSD
jgi:glyoxylate utilization-related uncharacterized protein